MPDNTYMNQPRSPGSDRLKRLKDRFSGERQKTPLTRPNLPTHNTQKSTTAYEKGQQAKSVLGKASDLVGAITQAPGKAVAESLDLASRSGPANFVRGLFGARQNVNDVATAPVMADDPRLTQQREKRLAMNPPVATPPDSPPDDRTEDATDPAETADQKPQNPLGSAPKVFTNQDVAGYDLNTNVMPAFKPTAPLLAMPGAMSAEDKQRQRQANQQAALIRQRGNGLSREQEIFAKAALARLNSKPDLSRNEERRAKSLQAMLDGANSRQASNDQTAAAIESGAFEGAANRAADRNANDARLKMQGIENATALERERIKGEAAAEEQRLKRPQQLQEAYADALKSARDNSLGGDQDPVAQADSDFLVTYGPEAFIRVRGAEAYRSAVGLTPENAKQMAQQAIARGKSAKEVVDGLAQIYPELSAEQIQAMIQ